MRGEPVRIVRRDDDGVGAAERCELVVEQRRSLRVERRVRLVQDQQRRVVEERAAEREPLRHAARVGRDALVARVPEAEALEEHPDPLAALTDAVEAAVEVEVLERGQLTVDERLVPDEPDPGTLDRDLERAARRRRQPGEEPEEGRLPGAVRPRDDQHAARCEVEGDVA
jgi:hypothetical protein